MRLRYDRNHISIEYMYVKVNRRQSHEKQLSMSSDDNPKI